MIKSVFINPGHHIPEDPGAVNPHNGLKEADVAQQVGKLVVKYLEAAGLKTFYLQSDSLEEIANSANNSGADVFVSIHCNAFNTMAKGTEVEIYGSGGEREILAQCIQDQIVKSLGTIDRGLKIRPNLYELKHTSMPAVLVELAFIDNDEDAELLIWKRDEFARAVARGITDYQSKNK